MDDCRELIQPHISPPRLCSWTMFRSGMFLSDSLWWDRAGRFIIPRNEGLNLNTLLLSVHLQGYSPAAWPTKAD